jgi:hypothetical protein
LILQQISNVISKNYCSHQNVGRCSELPKTDVSFDCTKQNLFWGIMVCADFEKALPVQAGMCGCAFLPCIYPLGVAACIDIHLASFKQGRQHLHIDF